MSFRRRNCCCGGCPLIEVSYRCYDEETSTDCECEDVPTLNIWSDSVAESVLDIPLETPTDSGLKFKCGETVRYRVSTIHVECDGDVYEFSHADLYYGCSDDLTEEARSGAYGEFTLDCVDGCACEIKIILWYLKIQDGPLECDYMIEGESGCIGTCRIEPGTWLELTTDEYDPINCNVSDCLAEAKSSVGFNGAISMPAWGFGADSGVCYGFGSFWWNYNPEDFYDGGAGNIATYCPNTNTGKLWATCEAYVYLTITWDGNAATVASYQMQGGMLIATDDLYDEVNYCSGWASAGGISDLVEPDHELGTFYTRGHFRRALIAYVRGLPTQLCYQNDVNGYQSAGISFS